MRIESLPRRCIPALVILLILYAPHVAAQTGVGGRVTADDRGLEAPPVGIHTSAGGTGVFRPDFDEAPHPARTTDGPLRAAAARETARLALSGSSVERTRAGVERQAGERRRSWIGRHPVLFGALVGFTSGFLTGYLAGDDGIFDDFTAQFNGMVLGGVGAGVGAGLGAIAGAATK